jgi:uridine kinase
MIDALITGLSKGLELSAEEIADTLWLALQIEESQPELSVVAGLKEDPPQPPLKRGEPEVLPEISTYPSELEETASNQLPDEPKAGIYPRNPQESLVGSGLSLRVPDAPSLREPLTLARALKPLMRRMPSGSTLVLDEAATTQQIAETGLWLPVLKPTLEPWLDLELVVDEGISMQIWRHTIGELERLLKNYGIFRDVRVWGLIADDSEASDLPRLVQIRRGIGATAKHQSPRSPAELIDPSGRRLILVVSDCVSPQWRDGKLTTTLEIWAKQGSMAIVQMLPKWLWKRTALGRASEVRLQGLNPGEFNQKLIAKGVSLWDELDETRGVKVPIFTLEPERVATWAQMLSGKGSTWIAGYVFKLDPLPARQGRDLFNLDVNRPPLGGALARSSPEQRVQAFRVTASPMARKLAGLLAAAPVISLPIVRLIQETLLKESQQVHVAEVFLGGLLKPLSKINPETNPNYVQYEFMDGVRELLADSVPSGYVLDVVDAVSKYVARKVGLSLEEFAAVLRNPPQVVDGEISKNIGYFASMTAQTLRRLGGEYIKIAEELEKYNHKKNMNLKKLVKTSDQPKIDKTIVIGISGGSCSGKTWLVDQFEKICPKDICRFELDGYYKELEYVDNLEHTHDNPDSIDLDCALRDLLRLKAGEETQVPRYSFETHSNAGSYLCKPSSILVVEGIFAFSKLEFLQEFDFKVWIEADDIIRYKRRLDRDVKERGRDTEEVAVRYDQNVKPGYEKFIYPNRRSADITIHNNDRNNTIPEGLYALLAYCIVDRSIFNDPR